MKTKTLITMLISVAMILAAPLAALGAPPDGKGPGGGSSAGDAAGALYGDLYVIERDGNGKPLPRTVQYAELDETGNPSGEILEVSCNQPLAKDCQLLPLWAECDVDAAWAVDEGFILPDGIHESFAPGTCVFNPELNDPCAVYNGTETVPDPTFTDLLQTVAFGRESVGRSPASVLDSSYAEALKTMNEATAMSKDPAGRIMLYLPEEDNPESFFWKTIDAPLENLGMYRAVMINGCLSPITEIVIGEEGQSIEVLVYLSASAKTLLGTAGLGHLVCNATLPEPKTKPDFLSSAAFIGAAADKTSPVTLDEIINMNTYLQINPYTYTRSGKNRTLEVTYLDFGVFNYVFGADACVNGTMADLLTYDFDAKTFAINSVNVFGDSPPGVALRDDPDTSSDVEGVAITVCRAGLPYGEICDLGISNTPYDPDLAIGCGGANWFAQAAEDARKTIWYLHNYEVPELAY